MTAFFAARAIAGIETVASSRYTRSITIGSAIGFISVEPVADRPALRATVTMSDPDEMPAVLARLRAMFDCDTDPLPIAAHLSNDPLLAPLLAARPGLRVPGAWDAWELAVRAILGQQITVVGARALAGRLVAQFGSELPLPQGAITHLFPPPSAVADVTEFGLALGMPRMRAASITGLARAASDDPSLLSAGGGLDATVARLRALPGVGSWTAHYIAMRALRELDAFPADDAGLRRATATVLQPPSAAALLARAERWRPWRAYAAQHLWSADAQTARS
ncbi:MAG: DNA-3-methyladenine glycosylase 2 family protein [Acidisphaera sp.]|nr:DNA-3-methyladenine glycosylase 2 family protein [Acidisphaera sp.]MBV9812845.1 DNA-3-methyladenine glycosylase 2 family protein [Acetobacteraceae bacterium]